VNGYVIDMIDVGHDDLYLRLMAKKGVDDLRSLIHELGHRWWYKFMSPVERKAVTKLYQDMTMEAEVLSRKLVKMPGVGDPLPIPLAGAKNEKLTIVSDSGGLLGLSPDGKRKVKKIDLRNILKRKAVMGYFPTPYSTKDHEEFFSECFSFYVLGKLNPDLSKRFEAVI
jgi:hypothetical protein